MDPILLPGLTFLKSNNSPQDKGKETAFFDKLSETAEYNVFTEESNLKLLRRCLELSGLEERARIMDLGCGSGVFTFLLNELGFRCYGLDISAPLVAAARRKKTDLSFVAGDIELLPLRTESLDAILLSGVIHHFPSPLQCAREVFRVLKPNGVFVAFDPNRRNPFMWLYRDRSSPFYSSKGVTDNERPVVAEEVREVFGQVGFAINNDFLSGINYRYVASPLVSKLLPIYNFLDERLFRMGPLTRFSAFVLTCGRKEGMNRS